MTAPAPFTVRIYLPGEPKPWDPPAVALPAVEEGPAPDDGPDSLAAWEKRTADVCAGCGLRDLDVARKCRACGRVK